MAATLTNTARRQTLNSASATGGPLFEANLHLYQNAISISPTTALGDLVECDFVGYTPSSALAFGTSFIGPDGRITLTAASQDFVMTANTTPNTVFGYYLTDTDDLTLVGAEAFVNPIPLDTAFQGLTADPKVFYGQ